jgi:hypothetical protein
LQDQGENGATTGLSKAARSGQSKAKEEEGRGSKNSSRLHTAEVLLRIQDGFVGAVVAPQAGLLDGASADM